MPRRRSGKAKPKPGKESNARQTNVLQSIRDHGNHEMRKSEKNPHISSDICNVKPLLEDEKNKSGASHNDSLSDSTAALHDELDTFRQRWKREIEVNNPRETAQIQSEKSADSSCLDDVKENITQTTTSSSWERPDNSKEVYALAKKLFLMGVDLEQDEMHHESIRYYKQAVHLCPDIEKQIFKEQCEASLNSSTVTATNDGSKIKNESSGGDGYELPLLERIRSAFHEDRLNHKFGYCRPAHKNKVGSKHIANLPHDLILQVFRYVIGKELDLASLESLGLVCRGFHILTYHPSLWRSICYTTWSGDHLDTCINSEKSSNIDWRTLYLTKPRVNCDGVYISRTKYIRQGDVGFQDITYRPFHIVRYYRYLRFFPDSRVLILTTNEEPDKIIPIFRHALHSKQFSSELSILDGTYKLVSNDELIITAEKDFAQEHDQMQHQTYNQRRQARFHWSRQTPMWQKFSMRFKLKTLENRAFKNNVLKWMEYSILSRTELGQELTEFDLSPDTFPVLTFARVKKFNLRLTDPLPSH